MEKPTKTLPSDTWCNPLVLGNYPIGFLAPGRRPLSPKAVMDYSGPPRDFRELADPEVLYDNGKWYMFPSVGEVYVSEDLAHWQYHKIQFANGEKLGYAPTITKCKGQYLLTSSWPFAGKAEILAADSPLGPYLSLGTPVDSDNIPLGPEWLDPMLFTDEDERLYAYWYYGGTGEGVFAIELDADNPVHGIGKPVNVLQFSPENIFERYGDFNEHSDMTWLEGESMFKYNNEYYLQYSVSGTQFRSYAVGVARGKSPLGPFTKQTTPVAREKHGRVCGTGHGCWCKGPDNTVWQFYTALNRRIHMFERRIGMDKVEFDQAGNAYVKITSTPQSVSCGDLGLLPVSVCKKAWASSSRGYCYPGFAFDDCTHSWWMPEFDDQTPWIEVNLQQEFAISAFQVIWAEEGVDLKNNIIPEPARYKLEFFSGNEAKTPVAVWDYSSNDQDLLIDFRSNSPVQAQYIKLSFMPSKNPALHRGVNNLTLFGIR